MSSIIKSNVPYLGLASALPQTGLIDLNRTAFAAFGLRRLSNAYQGSAIRVRRSSDDQEADIGFVGPHLDEAALLSFAGAGSAYVTTWYDQGASGRDITTDSDAKQPRIVNSGVIDRTDSGRPTVNFNGSSHEMNLDGILGAQRNSARSYIIALAQSLTQTGSQNLFAFSVSNSGSARLSVDVNVPGGIERDVRAVARRVAGNASALALSATSNGLIPLVVTADAAWQDGSLYLRQNGLQTASAALASSGLSENADSQEGFLGSVGGGNYFNGNISEFISYNEDQEAALGGIEANMMAYHGVSG